MWILQKTSLLQNNVSMEMNRSKKRIFEILIFIDSLLVPLRILNVDCAFELHLK